MWPSTAWDEGGLESLGVNLTLTFITYRHPSLPWVIVIHAILWLRMSMLKGRSRCPGSVTVLLTCFSFWGWFSITWIYIVVSLLGTFNSLRRENHVAWCIMYGFRSSMVTNCFVASLLLFFRKVLKESCLACGEHGIRWHRWFLLPLTAYQINADNTKLPQYLSLWR
jgi:hypothetical protein